MKYGREVTFTLPEPSILLNVWQRKHWAERKKYHERLCLLIRSALAAESFKSSVPFQMCRIEVDRFSAGTADWDGVMGGLKPLFDCLVKRTDKNPLGLGVIEDDNPSVITTCPIIRQHKSTRKAASTVVTITEILEA